MQIDTLFMQRYDPLTRIFLTGIWAQVPHDLMRLRPHARVNSIAWNLWHIARCEDAGLNRFLADRPQVLDKEPWMERMNLPWRHHGSGMTFAEVDELSQRVDLGALQAYSLAVQESTRHILSQLSQYDLDSVMQEQPLRQILVNEGLAHSQPEEYVQNYLGWSKAKCLITFGLTHSFQHIGEIEVLASLLGVEFK